VHSSARNSIGPPHFLRPPRKLSRISDSRETRISCRRSHNHCLRFRSWAPIFPERTPRALSWSLSPTLRHRVVIPSRCPRGPAAMRPVMCGDKICLESKQRHRNAKEYHLRATRLIRCAPWPIRPPSLLFRCSVPAVFSLPLYSVRRKIFKAIKFSRSQNSQDRQLSCKTCAKR